jgi:tetratricopeptide (TPR) repeat protein
MGKKKRTRTRREEPSATSSRELSRRWIIGIVLSVTFLAFANCIPYDFAYDDQTQILGNEFIRDLRNLPKALVTETWYWRVQHDQDPNTQAKPSTPYYRPIFTIYLMILWKLFGAWPLGWHFFNIIVHMLVVYLVFLMLERLSGDLKISAIASLIFAIHPMRSESVAWISGVTDPILAVFLVSSFYFYMRFRQEGVKRLLLTSLVLFFLAVFAKEPAVALAIFVVTYELLIINLDVPFRQRIKPAIKYGGCFIVVSAIYFVARYYALGFALNNGNFKYYPLWQVILTIPIVIWKYIGLMLWPVELSLFHATTMVRSPLSAELLVPLLGLLALAYGFWRLRGSIIIRFGILWFAVNLLPVLNLSAFGEDFLVQERYVYVPSIGFSLLIAIALLKIPVEKWIPGGTRRVAQTALVTVLVLLLGGKSLAQNTTWRDDMTVWYHGEKAASDQFMSHYVLGHKLINLGDYVQAAQQLEECLKIAPDNLIVISNLASSNVLIYQYAYASNPLTADRAPLDRALELCEKGLSKTTEFAPLWDSLGTIYTFETGLKNYDRAIACFQHALALSPGNAMMTFHLGGTLAKKGDLDNGVKYLQLALEQNSGIVDAHKFLAYVYKAKGQYKEAINELNIYMKMQPNAPDASRAAKDVQDLQALLQAISPQG